MRLPVLLVLSALITGAPLLASAQSAPEIPETEAAAPSLPAISVATASLRPLTQKVIATGFVTPVEEVQVQPLIEGQPVEALLADIGDVVTEGQVLARLSRTTLDLQLSQSKASLASARATVAQAEAQMVEAEASAADAARAAERTRKLKDQGSATQAASDTANANAVAATARVSVARESLEAARAQVAVYDSQLANTELQLTRTEVKAPYAGRIVQRNATIGSIASAAGQPMFVLEKDGALELRADVGESDLLLLEPGQAVSLIGIGLTTPLQGSVRLVEPAIDATTRLGRARIALSGDSILRAGMYLEAAITIAEREALAVPVTAVGATDGKPTVLRVGADGALERVTLALGIRAGGLVEVAEGLTAGDQIVSKAGAFVRPGDRINPVTEAVN